MQQQQRGALLKTQIHQNKHKLQDAFRKMKKAPMHVWYRKGNIVVIINFRTFKGNIQWNHITHPFDTPPRLSTPMDNNSNQPIDQVRGTI